MYTLISTYLLVIKWLDMLHVLYYWHSNSHAVADASANPELGAAGGQGHVDAEHAEVVAAGGQHADAEHAEVAAAGGQGHADAEHAEVVAAVGQERLLQAIPDSDYDIEESEIEEEMEMALATLEDKKPSLRYCYNQSIRRYYFC